MRVLLIPAKSNYPSIAPTVDHVGQALPYLAAALKAKGHEVYGMNMAHQRCQPSAEAILKRSLKKYISMYKPDIIGLSGLSADFLFVRDTIRIIRNVSPNTPIIGGGGLFSSDLNFVFSELQPDFAVIGEGEKTIVELLDSLNGKRNYDSIPGIAYWNDRKPVYNQTRKPIDDLDELPFPDYSPFDFETYLMMLNQKDGYFHCRTRQNPRLMPVSAARSCAFNCTFCYHTTGKKYRVRAIDKVISEIAYFYERYQFNILKLYDELFSIDENRVRRFCECMRELKYDIDWSCSLRVSDVNLDMLREMKEAGCIHVGYGMESASPEVLASMNKKTTIEQIRNAIELTEKAGIGVQGTFIFGDIVETQDTIMQTISFYNNYCRDHIIHCDYITPYPGSTIFNYCIENKIITDKRNYYKNIHRRPRINMTKLSYKDFRKSIDRIVSNRFDGVRSSSIRSCERKNSYDFKINNQRSMHLGNYKVSVICPHCGKVISYLFPLKNGSSEPLLNICSKCNKKFVILPFEPRTLDNQSKNFLKKKVMLSIEQLLIKLRFARIIYNFLFRISRIFFPKPL